jgi:hypothetical protein
MNTAKPILIAVLIGITALFAARECHRRSEGARFQAIVQESTAFIWRPERVDAARQRARPYLLASHLWAGAAWSLIAAGSLSLVLFPYAFRAPRT